MGFSFNDYYADYSNDYITVRKAAEISGYNQQYLRRLLRENTFRSKRIGRLWLIDQGDIIRYLQEARRSRDITFWSTSK